jgi:hypothetical protein
LRRPRASLVWAALAFALQALSAQSQTLAPESYQAASVTPDTTLRIVTEQGRSIAIRPDTGQVGFDRPAVAPNHRAVGWLALYPNECCTTYPIALALVIYANGRPQSFTGNGLSFARWRFEADGAQVSFRQETVHGGMGIYYELHDVATGKLLAAYDPDVGRAPPAWVERLERSH